MDLVSRVRCRGVVTGGVGGLGNDTVLQLWAEAREDWNDTVAQVCWCTAARDMWPRRRERFYGAIRPHVVTVAQVVAAGYSIIQSQPWCSLNP